MLSFPDTFGYVVVYLDENGRQRLTDNYYTSKSKANAKAKELSKQSKYKYYIVECCF